MLLKELMPWRRAGLRRREGEGQPLQTFRYEICELQDEMDRLFEGF